MGGTGAMRFVAAGVAGLVALLYLLIGFDVITVVQDQAETGAAPVVIAGLLFAALAVLLLVTASRGVFVAGLATTIPRNITGEALVDAVRAAADGRPTVV